MAVYNKAIYIKLAANLIISPHIATIDFPSWEIKLSRIEKINVEDVRSPVD